MANDKLLAEAFSLQPSALISFYVLDLTSLGGGILHLTPYQPGMAQETYWQGIPYSAYPVEFAGNEFKGQGSTPRPTIRFSNILGTFTSLCLEYQDLCGATVTRRRTFARFLDGMPEADPAQAWPDDIFEIDRKSYEDRNTVEFELASAMDVDGVLLPRRQVMASMCGWIYRSPECGFAANRCVATKDDVVIPATPQNFRGEWSGAATYAVNDVVWRQITPRAKRFYMARGGAPGTNAGVLPPNPTFWTEDLCSLTVRGCNKRFKPGPLPYGGFPGTHKVQGTA